MVMAVEIGMMMVTVTTGRADGGDDDGCGDDDVIMVMIVIREVIVLMILAFGINQNMRKITVVMAMVIKRARQSWSMSRVTARGTQLTTP